MSVRRAGGSGLRDEALHPPIRGASCTGRARARRFDGLSFFGDQSSGQDRAIRLRQKPRVVRSTPSVGRRRGANRSSALVEKARGIVPASTKVPFLLQRSPGHGQVMLSPGAVVRFCLSKRREPVRTSVHRDRPLPSREGSEVMHPHPICESLPVRRSLAVNLKVQACP
jgi:hypothetical protein